MDKLFQFFMIGYLADPNISFSSLSLYTLGIKIKKKSTLMSAGFCQMLVVKKLDRIPCCASVFVMTLSIVLSTGEFRLELFWRAFLEYIRIAKTV